MTLVAGHNGGRELAGDEPDQEQSGLNPELASDIPKGIVPGNDQVAVFPQLNDYRLIDRLKGPDLGLHRCSFPFDSRLYPWGSGCPAGSRFSRR